MFSCAKIAMCNLVQPCAMHACVQTANFFPQARASHDWTAKILFWWWFANSTIIYDTLQDIFVQYVIRSVLKEPYLKNSKSYYAQNTVQISTPILQSARLVRERAKRNSATSNAKRKTQQRKRTKAKACRSRR